MKKDSIKTRIRNIIFRSDFPAAKAFDIVLLILIVLAVAAVMLESIDEIDRDYHKLLFIFEWVLTILFTIEYALRIWTSPKPWAYIRSFYGIVDLISILPTYLSVFALSSQYLATIRALRLLRIFRIFKLTRYLGEMRVLMQAIRASAPKIIVFLSAVLICTIILGSIMYLIESKETGFTSIPRSIYWAIVTLTTVGYGDIAPQTPLGQAVAAIVMILGYGVIAVPTGVVSVELNKADKKKIRKENRRIDIDVECPICEESVHLKGAKFCGHCGTRLPRKGVGEGSEKGNGNGHGDGHIHEHGKGKINGKKKVKGPEKASEKGPDKGEGEEQEEW